MVGAQMLNVAPMKRVDPRGFTEYTGTVDFANLNYLAATGFMAFFGFLLALILVVFPTLWAIFALSRRLCCGRRAPPSVAPPAKHLLAAGVFFGCAAIVALGGGAAVIASGPPLFNTIRDIVDDAVATITAAAADATTLVNAVSTAVVPSFTATGISTTQVNANIVTLSNNVKKLTDAKANLLAKGHDAAHGGFVGVSVLGALIIGIAVFSSIGWALRSRGTLIGTSVLMWLSAVLVWLIAGITYVIYLFSADGCNGINFVLADPPNSGLTGFLPCLDSNGWVLQQESNALQPIWLGFSSANTALSNCAGQNTAPVGIGMMCNPIVPVPNTPFYAPSPLPCTPPNVQIGLHAFANAYNATTCPGLAAVPNALLGYGAVTDSSTLLVSLIPIAQRLINCTAVLNMMDDVASKCPTFTEGARMLYRGMIAAAVGMTLALIAMIVGYRHLGAANSAVPTAKEVDAVEVVGVADPAVDAAPGADDAAAPAAAESDAQV